MYLEEFKAAANAAAAKVKFLQKNPAGFFVMSMLAGMYVGIGVLFAFTCGGLLAGQPYAKVVMGAAFDVALSLVVFAGAELFTGSNMVMTAGFLQKKSSLADCIKVWVICYLGNWAGGIFLAFIYSMTGLCKDAVGECMASAALAKMSAPGMQLFARGILCNFLVCLAVWCGFRCKSEAAKLVMIFLCLCAFFTSGFEHCVANMTLLSIAIINPCGQAVSIGGYLWNMLFVTLGNMAGGIVLVGLPYFIGSCKDA